MTATIRVDEFIVNAHSGERCVLAQLDDMRVATVNVQPTARQTEVCGAIYEGPNKLCTRLRGNQICIVSVPRHT